MKLNQISESEVFDTKVDILLDRLNSVPELDTKLKWIINFGGKRFSDRARKVYEKIYNQEYDFKLKRKHYALLSQIIRNDTIWRDINEEWFLNDLDRLIPQTWKNGTDQVGYRLLQLMEHEKGPGDDSGLQRVLAVILRRLLYTPAKNEVGPLMAKHILSEIFA